TSRRPCSRLREVPPEMSVRVQVRSVPASARDATSPAAEAKTRTAARPARPRGLLADGLVLSLLVALSPALTIAGLGFTGADWRLLRALGGAPQASLAALVRAVGAAV